MDNDIQQQLDDFMTQANRPSNEAIVAHTQKMIESGKIIRKLSRYERDIWGGTMMAIRSSIPFMSNMVAVLNPMVDVTAQTTYVNQKAQMGIFVEFFYTADIDQRIMFVLHEAMHVSNKHFSRGEGMSMSPSEINECGDLEINTTLQRIPRLQEAVKIGLLPERYPLPKGQTMEQYKLLLDQKRNEEEDGSNSSGDEGESGQASEGQDGSKSRSGRLKENLENNSIGVGDGTNGESGNGQSGSHGTQCDEATDERSQAAQSEGISETSNAGIVDACRETMVAIQEYQAKGHSRYGHGDLEQFAQSLLEQMSRKSVVPWRTLLRKTIASSYADACRGYRERSFKRINRRFSGGRVILPGTVDYKPSVMFGIDTSGSMDKESYIKVLTEIEEVIQRVMKGNRNLKMFCVDTKVGKIETVSSTKEIVLSGGGGTDMSVAFKSINLLPKKQRPDLFVLCTDGFFDFDQEFVNAVRDYDGKSIILVTTQAGMDYAKQSPGYGTDFTVIDLSVEEDR